MIRGVGVTEGAHREKGHIQFNGDSWSSVILGEESQCPYDVYQCTDCTACVLYREKVQQSKKAEARLPLIITMVTM